MHVKKAGLWSLPSGTVAAAVNIFTRKASITRASIAEELESADRIADVARILREWLETNNYLPVHEFDDDSKTTGALKHRGFRDNTIGAAATVY
jgi:hypothetical protein